MKKLTLFFLSLLALSLGFQACDNSKTYAEMLEEEKDGINDFIKDRNIKVISQSEFYGQDSTTKCKDRGDSESGNGFSFKMCWMWQTGDGAKKDG